MKTFAPILIIILSAMVCRAQSINYGKDGTSAKNYFIKIPYEAINGRIFINVELAGKRHRFLFDTGAPVCISNELAINVGIVATGKNLITDVNGSTDSVNKVALNGLRIGSVSFNHITAFIFPASSFPCWSIEGVIGSNLFCNSIVQINSINQTIILTDNPGKLLLGSKKYMPLTPNNSPQNIPIIKVGFKNKENIDLEFDTGDNEFLRMSETMMSLLNKSGRYKLLDTGYGANSIGNFGLEKRAEKYLIKIPLITIDGCRFMNVITETGKNRIPGIGSKLLNFGIVTIDFIRGRFYFTPFHFRNDLNEKQWPFQPTVIGDRLVVGVVWHKADNLVTPGDQIIAVNGLDYTSVDLCSLLIKSPILDSKERALITVKDKQGKISNVLIK